MPSRKPGAGFFLRSKQGQPFQTNLPQEQETVSAGCFFTNGCLQTGQFLRHIFAPDFSFTNAIADNESLDVRRSRVCHYLYKFQTVSYRTRLRLASWRSVDRAARGEHTSVARNRENSECVSAALAENHRGREGATQRC